MLPQSPNKTEFLKIFRSIARHKHRYDVFRDFVTMSALSLHNAVVKSQDLEDEYMSIVAHYSKDEAVQMSHLLSHTIELLQPAPIDVLGQLYMELELGNIQKGQFFTPPDISKLMASISATDLIEKVSERQFITMSEPACGSGGMVLALVDQIIEAGHNPAHALWVQCIDIDRLASLMCYIQLTLWNVPGEIIVGNTLTLECREGFYTPAHYMNDWDSKLKMRKLVDACKELDKKSEDTPKTNTKKSSSS